MRFRYIFIFFGSLLFIAAMFLTDPDGGMVDALKVGYYATTIAALLTLASKLLPVLFAHLSRKALFDYLDLQTLARKAAETPVGSAIIFLAVCIVIHGILGLFQPARAEGITSYTYRPEALALKPFLRKEIKSLMPELPWPHYVPALIDHESGCPGLKSCWSTKARLRATRKDGTGEEGAGLPQLTRVWRSDGSVRFDIVTSLAKQHPALLGELNWGNVYERADLQIRAMVVLIRENWRSLRMIPDMFERLAMTDACYNGGCGDLRKERQVCALKKGCDASMWFGHVETTCVKSRRPLYGNRSACDINRYHVKDVTTTRLAKYRRFFAWA